MNELPQFLSAGGQSLFSVLHLPKEPPRECFVFCHALAEEKLWAHRVFVAYARILAAAGCAVLRFDFMGMGDSDGDFEAASVTTALADTDHAIAEIRRRTGTTTVNLLGLRFGATVASLVAERAQGIGKLVLWAPIVDGERYMLELLRVNVATQLATNREVTHDREQLVAMLRQGQTVNVDGYELGPAGFAEASAIRLAAAAKRHAGPCLVVRIDRLPAGSDAELAGLAATYPNGTLAHAEEDPFWKETARSYLRGADQLFAVTSRWLGIESSPGAVAS